MSTPFDYLNAITYSKKDIMRNTANDALAEREYNQFLVNRGLSYFQDTILISNEMNIKDVDNRMHFTFLLHLVRSKKRFSKWTKRESSEEIELIQRQYGYSYDKACKALKLLTPENIEYLKNLEYEGGRE